MDSVVLEPGVSLDPALLGEDWRSEESVGQRSAPGAGKHRSPMRIADSLSSNSLSRYDKISTTGERAKDVARSAPSAPRASSVDEVDSQSPELSMLSPNPGVSTMVRTMRTPSSSSSVVGSEGQSRVKSTLSSVLSGSRFSLRLEWSTR